MRRKRKRKKKNRKAPYEDIFVYHLMAGELGRRNTQSWNYETLKA